MIEAVTSCSHKTIHYALLVGELWRSVTEPAIQPDLLVAIWHTLSVSIFTRFSYCHELRQGG
jgi:hypothetical protein